MPDYQLAALTIARERSADAAAGALFIMTVPHPTKAVRDTLAEMAFELRHEADKFARAALTIRKER